MRYDAYLAKDLTLNDPEVVQVEKGGRSGRIINDGTATAFFISTPGLVPKVVAGDGTPCQPVQSQLPALAQGQRCVEEERAEPAYMGSGSR